MGYGVEVAEGVAGTGVTGEAEAEGPALVNEKEMVQTLATARPASVAGLKRQR
jgi:hypothetical protein